jgi:cbb3-type cytochrome oxidase subunit 1
VGICIMAYNMFKTIAVGKAASEPVPAALAHA